MEKIEASNNDINDRDDWRKVYLQLEGTKVGSQFEWNEKDEKGLAEFIKRQWDAWEKLNGRQKPLSLKKPLSGWAAPSCSFLVWQTLTPSP